MKKNIFVFIFLIPIFLIASNSRNNASKQEIELKVGAFNYYPSIFKDKDEKIKGFIVDILSEIAINENWKINYLYGSWKEGLNRIQNDSIDLFTSVAFTEERNKFMDYSKESILTVWGGVYVRNGSEISSITDLYGKKIAVMEKDYNGESFKHLINSFNVACEIIEMRNFDQLFESVRNGSVDACVVNNIFGTAKQFEYSLKSTGIIFNPFDIFFTVAKNKNNEVLAAIDNYLADWKKDEGSPYHKALHSWTQKEINLINTIPQWVIILLSISSFLIVIAFLFISILRRQVKKATKEILENKEKHKNRFEYFPFPSFIWEKIGDDFEMKVANKAAYTESDGKIENIFGIKSKILWKDEPDLIENLYKCYDLKKNFTIDREYTFKSSGKTKFVSTTYSFLPPHSVQITTVDRTQQKEAEKELLHQKNLFETMFNSINDGVVITNTSREIILANKGINNTFGYEPDELIGKTTKILYADENQYINIGNSLFNKASSSDNKTYQTYFKNKNNQIFPGETFGAKLYNESGEWIGNLGIMRNITERKQLFDEINLAKEKAETSQKELLEKHIELLQAQEVAKIGNWQHDLISEKVYLSDISYEIFGFTQEEFCFEKILTHLHPDDKKIVLDALEASAKGKKEIDHIIRMIRPDGKLIYIHDHWINIFDENGKGIKRIGTHQDITELKIAEESIRTSEIKYKNLISNISDVITIIDKNGIVQYKSPNITENFGWTPNEMIGEKIFSFIENEDFERIEKDFESLISLKDKKILVEFNYKCKDGSIKPVELTAVNLIDNPIINGIVANYKDISQRKYAEKAVIENQRLSAVGEIASSVAHDFNNALQAILGNLELAMLKTEMPYSITKYLEGIRTSAMDSAARVQLLQRFGGKKQNTINYTSVEINRILDEVIVQSRPLWKDNAEKNGLVFQINKQFEDLPLINGNPGELRTVIYNMLKNSIEAMPNGGNISIHTFKNSDTVKISISDNGIGMDENTRTRIFQPFFSTKGFEQGRGMGMSGAYSIIKEHGGTIDIINSTPGKGTTLQISLPISNLVINQEQELSVNNTKQKIKVLWVDDDKLIREIASEMLIYLNFTGDVVSSGDEALKLLNDNKYDLIVTDIGMPVMNGWQLADRIVEKFGPDIKIAILSGWGEQIDKAELDAHNINFVLAKPFQINQLKKLILESVE